ncbi:uncharacterized protein AruCF_4228 [Achromobacter ruhlandii]|nr:uncharacterized protein AruCF_4228 [Achromobacter ruhlandii]
MDKRGRGLVMDERLAAHDTAVAHQRGVRAPVGQGRITGDRFGHAGGAVKSVLSWKSS